MPLFIRLCVGNHPSPALPLFIRFCRYGEETYPQIILDVLSAFCNADAVKGSGAVRRFLP